MYSFSGTFGSDALCMSDTLPHTKPLHYWLTDLGHPLLDALPMQLAVAGVEEVTGVIVAKTYPTAALFTGGW